MMSINVFWKSERMRREAGGGLRNGRSIRVVMLMMRAMNIAMI